MRGMNYQSYSQNASGDLGGFAGGASEGTRCVFLVMPLSRFVVHDMLAL